MEKVNFNIQIKKDEKKAKYRWQDMCVELAKELGVEKGLLFKAWSVGGYPLLDKIKGDIEEHFPKTPIAYILYQLKNWK